MELSVLYKLTYGMYAIGTLDGTRPAGCIVNTVIQVTSERPIIAVSMNKNNFTYEAIKKSGRFSISILSEAVDRNVIAELGFACGREINKFCGKNFACVVLDGLPIVKEHACGYMICEVIAIHDAETHCVIMARLTDTLAGADESPMTYEYYHKVVKGKAPKNAPTYQDEAPQAEKPDKIRYICEVCGYIYEGDITKEPDDYVCPICKQPKSRFKKM